MGTVDCWGTWDLFLKVYLENTSAGGNRELSGSSIEAGSGSFFASSSNTGGGLFGNNTASGFENIGQSAGSEMLFVGPRTSPVIGGSWIPLLFFPTAKKLKCAPTDSESTCVADTPI